MTSTQRDMDGAVATDRVDRRAGQRVKGELTRCPPGVIGQPVPICYQFEGVAYGECLVPRAVVLILGALSELLMDD